MPLLAPSLRPAPPMPAWLDATGPARARWRERSWIRNTSRWRRCVYAITGSTGMFLNKRLNNTSATARMMRAVFSRQGSRAYCKSDPQPSKSEGRIPDLSSVAVLRRVEGRKKPECRSPKKTPKLIDSNFGIRPSFGLRPSDFGLGTMVDDAPAFVVS